MGKFQEPTQLNKRASDYLAKFHQAQEQLLLVESVLRADGAHHQILSSNLILMWPFSRT